ARLLALDDDSVIPCDSAHTDPTTTATNGDTATFRAPANGRAARPSRLALHSRAAALRCTCGRAAALRCAALTIAGIAALGCASAGLSAGVLRLRELDAINGRCGRYGSSQPNGGCRSNY